MEKKDNKTKFLVYPGLVFLSISCLCVFSPFFFGAVDAMLNPASKSTSVIKLISDFLLAYPALSFLIGIGVFSFFIIGIVMIIASGVSGSSKNSSGSISVGQNSQDDEKPDYGYLSRRQEYDREIKEYNEAKTKYDDDNWEFLHSKGTWTSADVPKEPQKPLDPS